MVISVSLVPNTASAKSSVHIALPGISIGFNDRYYSNRNNNRYRNNSYRNNSYRNNSYRNNSYRNNSYRNSNQYYYQPSRRVYKPSYQSAICPEPGYSANYYDGHGCRQHLDHFHCD